MPPDPPVSLWPDPDALGPLTDLYQLTMMAGYVSTGMDAHRATFEMFVRKLPPGRSYLVFAGLEQAVGDLLRLAFSKEQADDLRRWPIFASVDPAFFDWLCDLRFEGDLWAVREGTVVFAGEPLIRVEAPLPQAQWVETILLASIAYPTLVATKAARVVGAARGRPVYDFGLRRGHGPHAGMLAARASYLAGAAGTSNVEAARRLGIPASGTMAHSWVQAFDDELEAFRAFNRVFEGRATLLVDTYETIEGVAHAAEIEPPAQALRIDSGDLVDEGRRARALLDRHGLTSVKLFASGDLDEFAIERLLEAGAPYDAFGVGTELITSRDAPALALVYKLVALDGQGRIKLSAGKRTYPLAKQVDRFRDEKGRFSRDRVIGASESLEGEPLLAPVLRDGKLVAPLPRLDEIREHAARQCAALPDALLRFDAEPSYPVEYSAALEAEAERLARRG